MHKFSLFLALAAAAALPVHAQEDCKAAVIKHLTNSRDFTLNVAKAMPEADYGFKLTPEQMSFGEQLVHLSKGMNYFLSAFKGEKPNPPKPPSMNKSDVIAYVGTAFDKAIAAVSALTPEQLSKTYGSGGQSSTGVDLLIGMVAHNAHHRASAEMYLRAKGIKPPAYVD